MANKLYKYSKRDEISSETSTRRDVTRTHKFNYIYRRARTVGWENETAQFVWQLKWTHAVRMRSHPEMHSTRNCKVRRAQWTTDRHIERAREIAIKIICCHINCITCDCYARLCRAGVLCLRYCNCSHRRCWFLVSLLLLLLPYVLLQLLRSLGFFLVALNIFSW